MKTSQKHKKSTLITQDAFNSKYYSVINRIAS